MANFKITSTSLEIIASQESSKHDFDFLVGQWQVQNRRLKNGAWTTFESEIHMRKTLAGLGNVENYYAQFDGKDFEGQAVRLFQPTTRLWSIYWIDSNTMKMDELPVVGSFENGIGKFYALDNSTLIVYQWDKTDPENPIWSQATSIDEGITWEWNWEMKLSRKKK